MRALCNRLHIKKLTSTVYQPKINGTFKKKLGGFVENEKNEWDKYLPYLWYSY